MKLTKRMDDILELSTPSQETDASIMIPYALNSVIICSGDISVVGKGSINSNIHSDGKVKINGVLRGGEVFAAMGIETDEAGTIGGMSTHIRVPDGQSIKINHANEGTTIQIGKQTYKFTSTAENVFARVNKEGQLLLF